MISNSQGFQKKANTNTHRNILLLVGKNGYPIGYDVFEGSIYEGHTLIPVLERFEKRFNLEKPIVVADAGLLSTENIGALRDNQYNFILGARIKNESEQVKKQILRFTLEDGQIEKIIKKDNTKLFISYSQQRAKKDAFNREKGLKRLEKSLRAGRLTKSNINNRGYNKYLRLEGEVKIMIDYEKFENDQKWDGLKGYITNTDLAGKEVMVKVIDSYNNLWLIVAFECRKLI